MSIKVTIPSVNFIDYLDFFNYTGDHKTTFRGFIKPKKEFEQFFNCIINYRMKDSNISFKKILSPEIDSFESTDDVSIIDINDVFEFEFEDEETALYVALKYKKP